MSDKIQTTEDLFLGGKLAICQLKKGYRAGNDPVLLAASLTLKKYQTLLDLGCGVGTAFLCALVREKSLEVTGVELQKTLSDLAKSNCKKNKLSAEIINSDINKMWKVIGDKTFDHVIFNPPFMDANKGTVSLSREKSLANFSSEEELKNWLKIGMKRLKPKGTISLILRVESLGIVLKTLEEKVGSIKILPIASFEGESCSRIIVSAKLGSKGNISLLSPLIMHLKSLGEGKRFIFTKSVRDILYEGKSIEASLT